MRDLMIDEYFEWLYDLVCGGRYADDISYRKLLTYLHDTEFRYHIPKDGNRAEDGKGLRWRFTRERGYRRTDCAGSEPCSVLEMMIALAIRCEENIMDDPRIGDRTGQWFWVMIQNLHLRFMTDDRFDEIEVRKRLDIFLDREYAPNGDGGLFIIHDCPRDLRDVEIWHQLCWYLDTIT